MITLPIPSLENLKTERLSFRHLTLEDVDWWMGYINDATAIRFMPFTRGSRADCEFMIKRAMDRYTQDGSGLNALLLRDGTPVGQCGLLLQEVGGQPELEIGYHLLPEHWGKGYASEAANASKLFVFKHRIASSVISLIDPGNALSQAVARKNGMTCGELTMHRGIPAHVWRVWPDAEHN